MRRSGRAFRCPCGWSTRTTARTTGHRSRGHQSSPRELHRTSKRPLERLARSSVEPVFATENGCWIKQEFALIAAQRFAPPATRRRLVDAKILLGRVEEIRFSHTFAKPTLSASW